VVVIGVVSLVGFGVIFAARHCGAAAVV